MHRGRRTANYAAGTATDSTNIVNLYKYGGSVWIVIYLLMGLLEAGTLGGATGVLFDVYLMKLFGWPWDHLLFADSFWGLIRSHVQTWIVGWGVATLKYGMNS